MSAARSGSKNITASAANAPPLVAPNERTSTPAIHVHRHSARVRDVGKLADFIWPIDRARFSRLRERQHARADMMRTAPRPRAERALQGRGRNLTRLAR